MRRAGRPLALLVATRDRDRGAQLAALWEGDLDVECAESALECIRLVRQLRPSVIVMHRFLSDGDGWELVRVLKSLSSTQYVPVVAIAEDDSRHLMRRAFSAGCDAFLAKPFEPRAMLRQIRRLLERSGRAPEEVGFES